MSQWWPRRFAATPTGWPEPAWGELVPPGDADALAGAVRALTNDPVRYLACAARARPLAERYGYGGDAIAGQLIALYRGA